MSDENVKIDNAVEIRKFYNQHEEIANEVEKLKARLEELGNQDSEICGKIYGLLPDKDKSLVVNGERQSLVARPLKDGSTTFFFRGPKKGGGTVI